MANLSFTTPTVGQSDTTEEPLIVTALNAIKTKINGGIDEDNLSFTLGASVGEITGLTSGQLIIGNASNIAQARTLSGDVTVSNTGVATIANGVVSRAKMASGAILTASDIDLSPSQQQNDAMTSITNNTWTTLTGITNATAASTGVYLYSFKVMVDDDNLAAHQVDFATRWNWNGVTESPSRCPRFKTKVAAQSSSSHYSLSNFYLSSITAGSYVRPEIWVNDGVNMSLQPGAAEFTVIRLGT